MNIQSQQLSPTATIVKYTQPCVLLIGLRFTVPAEWFYKVILIRSTSRPMPETKVYPPRRSAGTALNYQR